MRICAYVLAADATWIEASVLRYYDVVDRIVVTYDKNGQSWTGRPLQQQARCLERLKAIDRSQKMSFVADTYYSPRRTPMENDTFQRQASIDLVSAHACDWVLQIDSDEILPQPSALLDVLEKASTAGIPAVEWPMKVLYRRLGDGRYLQVASRSGGDVYEYPGPVAVRPGSHLCDARRTDGAFWRPTVVGDRVSLQLQQPLAAHETRVECVLAAQAIVHNSWGRRPSTVLAKIRTWSHAAGWKGWLYYLLRWLPAPILWPYMQNFHPFARNLWPALKIWDSSTLADVGDLRE